jgi:hypothetical protein
MLRFISVLFFFVSSVSAFQFSNKPIIRGPTAPLEIVFLFDQSFAAKGIQPSFLREAELKHGRICE